MQRRSFLVLVSELLALASIFLPGTASAFDYQISSPLVHDKLAVYFVHGNGSGGPVPLTLDQALANGAVKIHQDIHRDYFFTLSNSSNQSVFVQFGDLLKGGLQDQVVGRSLIVPPRSGPVPLDVLCVDPFRSTARDGEDGRIFLSSGAQFPSHTGKLSMLTGSSESEATRGLQQSGVWWSIDTTRSRLSQVLGEPLESPRAVHWKIDDGANNRAVVALAARRSSWTSSLPLALENRRLAQAQRPYVDALKAAGKRSGDIIGAVFVINGKVQGAEIYQSHVLFRHMWQKVLRAYATEAISSKDALSGTPPSVDTINAFLADAEGGQLRERTSDSHVLFRDSEAAIYAETQERDGRWVYRSYLSKLDPAAMPLTPDATVVKMLETGQVNGRPINTLADDETVVLDSNASGAGWTATVSSPERSADSTQYVPLNTVVSIRNQVGHYVRCHGDGFANLALLSRNNGARLSLVGSRFGARAYDRATVRFGRATSAPGAYSYEMCKRATPVATKSGGGRIRHVHNLLCGGRFLLSRCQLFRTIAPVSMSRIMLIRFRHTQTIGADDEGS